MILAGGSTESESLRAFRAVFAPRHLLLCAPHAGDGRAAIGATASAQVVAEHLEPPALDEQAAALRAEGVLPGGGRDVADIDVADAFLLRDPRGQLQGGRRGGSRESSAQALKCPSDWTFVTA